MKRRKRRYGLLAISPMFVLTLLFLGLGIIFGDFYHVPLLIIFIATAAYTVCITRGIPVSERIAVFSHGAGDKNLLMMIWIFILAGAFAAGAKSMGAIDATVNLTLAFLPSSMLLPGLFLSACLISLSIGTSVGTIVALVPVAAGLAGKADLSLPLTTACVVGGAFFGDNLSFISDTTIVATRTQGVALAEKFRVNYRLVLPAAAITLILYGIIGHEHYTVASYVQPEWLKTLPYLTVLIAAIAGMNVLLVLLIGNILTGVIGVCTHSFTVSGWTCAVSDGITGMCELIIISLLAGGMLELIRFNGGITYIIKLLTKHVRGKRGAELSIAALVSLTNICTANNTVAILSVGKLSNDIAERYGVNKSKSASILDTFSCAIQSILPYGAQLLMAAGLSGLNSVELIPHLYYPLIMGFTALLAILVRYPRRFS